MSFIVATNSIDVLSIQLVSSCGSGRNAEGFPCCLATTVCLQCLLCFNQAILALKYIHEQHILHRDLKSGNFFLSKSGNLKMGDFGIAKVMAGHRIKLNPKYPKDKP
eukprot:6256118-Amphidinium_carterae.1